MSVKGVKAFKLSSSVYRGSEKNAMLTRIYGENVLLFQGYELKEHLEIRWKKQKNANTINLTKMKIFTTVDVIGQGLPLIMPNGGVIMMVSFSAGLKTKKQTPDISEQNSVNVQRATLQDFRHWDYYKEGMFVLKHLKQKKKYLRFWVL